MTALAMDVRELNTGELDEVNGGIGLAIAVVGITLGVATFAMMVGERLHDAHCPDHR